MTIGSRFSGQCAARWILPTALLILAAVPSLSAADWYVAPWGGGNGTAGSPFGQISQALQAAQPGDNIILKAGTYTGTIRTVRAGSSVAPITILAEERRAAVLTATDGKVLRIDDAYVVVQGVVIDGQFGPSRGIDIANDAHGTILRDVEVKNSGRDCIDIGSADNVLIERSEIHHCLNAANGRTDAHGIVAGALRNLIIRDTEIHTFSGDGVQLDPDRSAPGWNQVRIERCRFWLEPLPFPTNGFPAGTVPGENAVDTKTWNDAPRASIEIVDSMAWGFRGGLIANQAAFNLKENIDATVDRVTVWNSEIAFRLRGPTSRPGAWVALRNSLIFDVDVAVRYEDDIQNLKIHNNTFGSAVLQPFKAASSVSSGLDVRNLLLLGTGLPSEASAPSNLSVGSSAFVHAPTGNYHLNSGSPAINAGETLLTVTHDRDGIARPQGGAHDVGAYEWCLQCAPAPPTNLQLQTP